MLAPEITKNDKKIGGVNSSTLARYLSQFGLRLAYVAPNIIQTNKADKLKCIDPILIAKYNMEITCKSSIVYNKGKPLLEMYPLVSAGKVGKGVNLYDANWLNNRPINPKTGKPIKRFIFVI